MILFDSFQQLKRAYDLARGRTMVALIFFWAAVFYSTMQSGRELRDAGHSLLKAGQDELVMLREKGRLEREEKMKKSEG